jgi:hypothetical protein
MNANLQKYLKYKAKYLDLKNELEGGTIKPEIAKEIRFISDQIKTKKLKLTGYNSQIQQIKPQMELYKKEINVLNDQYKTPKKRTTQTQLDEILTQKMRLESLYKPLKKKYDGLFEDISRLDEEIQEFEDQRKELVNEPHAHAPSKSSFFGWKKEVNDQKDDEDILDSKTRKSSVVDNNSLLQQIKENMEIIMSMQLEDDDNTRYLHSILEATSSFVSKLNNAMDVQNFEELKESIKDYSDSEKEQNKTGNGIDSLNKVMGQLSRLRDSDKKKEYNELLNRYSTTKQITNEYKLL